MKIEGGDNVWRAKALVARVVLIKGKLAERKAARDAVTISGI